tara:strand:- start:14099 stop:14392 length:294 start_codon:yes stop_codon:yes gene_type:complete
MENTTEQKLIEMADDMKTIVEEKDVDLRIYKMKYMDLKKTMAKIYGITRCLQDVLEDMTGGVDVEFVVGAYMLTEVRSMCSNILFEDEERKMDIYGY